LEIDDRNLTASLILGSMDSSSWLADHRSLVPATPRTRWRRPQTSRHRWLHPLTQHATLRGQREQSSTGLHRLLRLHAVIDAVIAAPDDWRQRVGGLAADGATVGIAPADAEPSPSPPATRSAMRAAAAAAAQLRASSG
jgi:hypothetical protein